MDNSLTVYPPCAVDATVDLSHRSPWHRAPDSELSSDRRNKVLLCASLDHCCHCDANDVTSAIVDGATSISIVAVLHVPRNGALALRAFQS